MENAVSIPESPFAKYSGALNLGAQSVDCYVLDDKSRVISMRATVKTIASDDNGDLSKYVGVKALNPFINSELLLGNVIEFAIPGNPIKAKGITAETFLDICSAYVAAYTSGAHLTDKAKGNCD